MNNDETKLDLSALDPTRDQLRFERLVRDLGGRAARAHRDPLWTLGKASLALAAGLALATWAPQLLATGSAESMSDPGAALLTWHTEGGPGSAAEVLASLGRTP